MKTGLVAFGLVVSLFLVSACGSGSGTGELTLVPDQGIPQQPMQQPIQQPPIIQTQPVGMSPTQQPVLLYPPQQQPIPLPPQDPNMRYLPPPGQPAQLPVYNQYFQGLQSPYYQGPVFQGPQAAYWANHCYQNRIDLQQFNQAYYFFASLQVQTNRMYTPLWNGHTAVRITTAVFEQYGQFDYRLFQVRYYDCLRRGFVGIQAVQQAFYSMNIRINVQEFVI